MKKALLVIRWVVGVLFIFSGLIKANDPLGLSYKMQEFFEAWGWGFLEIKSIYVLVVSLMMNTLEVVLGIALIIGWQAKLVTKCLFALIVFFTFLTGYALFSGKIKTCGCFGDCLPLTPIQTFTKDLILLALSIVLLFKQTLIKPMFRSYNNAFIFLASLMATVAFQNQVLNYLPVIDCLPYKVGNNILDLMKKPANAIPDSTVITYQYKKNDKLIEFDNNHFPNDFDSTYIYVNRFDKLIRKGSGEATIVDFNLQTLGGNDTTIAVLQGTGVYLFMKDFNVGSSNWHREFGKIEALCTSKKLPLFVVTATPNEAIKQFEKATVTILKCDGTVIKTAARVNPSYLIIKAGTIVGKYSYLNLDKIEQGIKSVQ